MDFHTALADHLAVPTLYRKADGSVTAYLLTDKGPPYEAKTGRAPRAPNPELVDVYDLISKRYLSLKIANLTICVTREDFNTYMSPV